MTYARSHLVDPKGGVYHLMSRCVRRTWLCGVDQATGMNFNHRRGWIKSRLLWLADQFPVDIYGYAIMSNHYHIVLNIEASRVSHWSDEEIVNKWVLLHARQLHSTSQSQQCKKEALLNNPEQLKAIRKNLGSLSWFMRCLNEPIARWANQEDQCKGRFWEGRFKSQRLLDEKAILACMVYVDLNPLRAGEVKDVPESQYTSLAQRTRQHALSRQLQPVRYSTFISSKQKTKPQAWSKKQKLKGRFASSLPLGYTLRDYIQLVNWTANKSPKKPLQLPMLIKLTQDSGWLSHCLLKPGKFCRAIGSVQSLAEYAQFIGQRWIKTC